MDVVLMGHVKRNKALYRHGSETAAVANDSSHDDDDGNDHRDDKYSESKVRNNHRLL